MSDRQINGRYQTSIIQFYRCDEPETSKGFNLEITKTKTKIFKNSKTKDKRQTFARPCDGESNSLHNNFPLR